VPAGGVALVRAEPNPSRGAIAFVATESFTEAASIEVLDLQGRLLRQLGAMPASGQPLQWDGKDTRGSQMPPGVYLARIRLRDRIQNLRVVLLP
jgi:flagellar hook assembly protein FlgD